MSLTKDSQRKQIIGIILVIVFLLAIFVYGTKGCRPSPNKCKPICQERLAKEKTCQAESGTCPVETNAVR